MLEHLNEAERPPSRVVVIGANGFVGRSTSECLEKDGVKIVKLGRAEVDLLADDASERLADTIKSGDAVVAISAIAPAKNLDDLMSNMRIVSAIGTAIAARSNDISHVVNISSDAVYADTPTPLNELSPTAPDSYHGTMHLAREVHFKTIGPQPLAILRPTLIYGASDPHNGYGPNKFRRLAADNQDISLFGEGEELRDHILVDDVAELIRLILLNRSHGVLNAVTGHVASFRDVAEMVVSHFKTPVAIKGTPRSGPMPHNGYRPFSIAVCNKAFPNFRFTPLADGIGISHQLSMNGEV